MCPWAAAAGASFYPGRSRWFPAVHPSGTIAAAVSHWWLGGRQGGTDLHGLTDTLMYRMRACLPQGSALPVERKEGGKRRQGERKTTKDLPDSSNLCRHLPEPAASQQQQRGARNSPSSAGDTDGYLTLKQQPRSPSSLSELIN